MGSFWADVQGFLAKAEVQSGLRAAAVVVGGLLVLWLVRRRLRRWKAQPQTQLLVRRAVTVTILAITLAWALRELGLSLGVLLGAAGIFTVAIGFAAQTSVSNIISGLFLMGEQPFKVGDSITVGTTTGEVISVDLLSIKLRTPDNLMVRVPNEMVLKSSVTNLTRFAIRRLDIKLSLAYDEDLGKVKSLLMGVADASPICLQEPKPLFIFLAFGESSIDVQFSVWAVRENFAELKTTMYERIKRALAENGIRAPYPHRRLVGPREDTALPVRLVEATPVALEP